MTILSILWIIASGLFVANIALFVLISFGKIYKSE